MFGYVVPYKDELKLKSVQKYKRYYCAVCNQIRKRYGRIATIFLSYEMVFTLILLDDFGEKEKAENMKLGCQFDIVRIGEIELSKELLDYLAWVNLHISFWKLKDNWMDEKRISSYVLYKMFMQNHAYKNDCKIYADACIYLDSKLDLFYDLEKNKNSDFDELSQLMGDTWQGIVEYGTNYISIEENKKELLKSICDDLAKFLYCIDAYDDYEEDIKNKRFNPLQKIPFRLDEKIDNGLFLVGFIIQNLQQKMFDIEFNKNSEIIKNVIFFGLEHKLKLIVKRKEKENAKRNFKK